MPKLKRFDSKSPSHVIKYPKMHSPNSPFDRVHP